jgi:hypothetical protein
LRLIISQFKDGLDLNPLFTGASTFRPTGDGAALNLFQQAHIDLVHGWLCDPDSSEYAALLQTQDYDSSMDLIAEADSLTNGQLVAASEWPGGGQPDHYPELTHKLGQEEQAKVENGGRPLEWCLTCKLTSQKQLRSDVSWIPHNLS